MFTFIEHLKGTVSHVNSTLCNFQIKSDDSCVSSIHAAVVNLVLPNQGEDVLIFNLYKESSEENAQYYLKEDAEFYSKSDEFGVFTQNTTFAKLIHSYAWGIEELQGFIHSLNKVKFEGIFNGEDDEIMLNVLTSVLHVETCYKSITLSTPSLCHYVKYGLVYSKCPQFSQGIHHSGHNEFLFGLFLSNKNCLLELTDGRSSIYLKIHADSNSELVHFLNRFICIKKFTIITEVYPGGINLEYLVCDISDVMVLDVTVNPEKCVPYFLYPDISPGLKYMESFQIYVLNIATPNSTANKMMDCWIEVKMKREEKWVNTYLCFEPSLFSTMPLLDVGEIYMIYLIVKLIFYTDPEIKRVAKSTHTYRVRNCVFVKLQNRESISFPDDNVLSLKELSSVMEKFSGRKSYVNFEAVITLRIFCPADDSSRTKREIKSTMFGTPGNKRHILRFEDMIDELKVSLYLNNWERKQCPLGVVPQVRVVVRHVEVSKNYLRSNALTNFEVIRYDNPIIFNTANLNPDNPRIFYNHLGNGLLIPFGTLIRAQPTKIQVRSFKLFYINEELQLVATFYTSDARGRAFVICKSLDLIKKTLFKNERQFNAWSDVFKTIRMFSIYEDDAPTLLPEHEFFYKCMLLAVKSYFNKGILSIDWLCRRMEPKQLSDNKGFPLWFACEIISIQT